MLLRRLAGMVIILLCLMPIAHASVAKKLTGAVTSIPHWKRAHISFILTTDHHRWYISWYGHHPWIQPGQIWQLPVRITKQASSQGSHFANWLYWHGISGSGYVDHKLLGQAKKIGNEPWWQHPLLFWRYLWVKHFWHLTYSLNSQDILLALALGDRGEFKSDRWPTFIHTGTSHLMSISGLHLGMVAGFIYLLASRIWSYLPCCRYFSAWQAGAWASMLGAGLYAVLTGLALPAARAWIMLAGACLAVIGMRQVSIIWLWALALVVMASFNPLNLGQAGAWLSFAAVAWLLWSYHQFRPSTWYGNIVFVQWILFWGLMPLELHFFGQVSIASWPANMIAIPLVTFVILPLTLVATLIMWASPTIALAILHGADIIMSYLYQYLSWLGSSRFWGVQINPLGIAITCLLLLASYLGLSACCKWLNR